MGVPWSVETWTQCSLSSFVGSAPSWRYWGPWWSPPAGLHHCLLHGKIGWPSSSSANTHNLQSWCMGKEKNFRHKTVHNGSFLPEAQGVDKDVRPGGRLGYSLISRPHPLMRRNGLVNQVKFLGLAYTFTTVSPSNIQTIYTKPVQ